MPHDVSSRLLRHSFIRVPNGRLSKRHCRLLQLSGRICQKLQPSEAQICTSFAFLVRTILQSWYVLTLFHWFICFFLYCWLLQVTHSYWWIHTPRLCHCIWCVFVSLHVCQKVAVLAWAREHYIEMEDIWGNWPCSRPLPWTTAMQLLNRRFLDASTEGVATHYSWHTFRAQKTHLFSRIQWQNSPTSNSRVPKVQ